MPSASPCPRTGSRGSPARRRRQSGRDRPRSPRRCRRLATLASSQSSPPVIFFICPRSQSGQRSASGRSTLSYRQRMAASAMPFPRACTVRTSQRRAPAAGITFSPRVQRVEVIADHERVVERTAVIEHQRGDLGERVVAGERPRSEPRAWWPPRTSSMRSSNPFSIATILTLRPNGDAGAVRSFMFTLLFYRRPRTMIVISVAFAARAAQSYRVSECTDAEPFMPLLCWRRAQTYHASAGATKATALPPTARPSIPIRRDAVGRVRHPRARVGRARPRNVPAPR